jgi:predicted amidohydrolase YtcJ
MGSAYAGFDEKSKGSIEPGKVADIAVLSMDILSVDPKEIANARVVMTVFDGRIIYERP